MAHFGQLNLVTLLRSLQDFTNHRTLCHFGHLITSMALWFYTFTARAQKDRIPSFYFDKALDNVRSYLIYTFTAYDMVFSRSCLSRATGDRPPFYISCYIILTFWSFTYDYCNTTCSISLKLSDGYFCTQFA